MKKKAKYTPKKLTVVAYMALIAIGVLLEIGRWHSVSNESFVLITEEIDSHLSNFTISFMLYLGMGYPWILLGAKVRSIAILGLFIGVANFMCETLMAFMNTIDVVDAIYGIIGTMLGFVFLLIVIEYGLQKNKSTVE